jgi:hypothetical protein
MFDLSPLRWRPVATTTKVASVRITFWLLIVLTSVFSGGFFLHDNTMEFWNATVQTTLDGSVPLSEVFFPSVLVCNINQGRTDSFLIQSYFK